MLLFVVSLMLVVLTSCNSQDKPLSQLYQGTYNFVPESSIDLGFGSQIIVRATDVRVVQLYCEDAIPNYVSWGNVIGSDSYVAFQYDASSFTLNSCYYTSTEAPYGFTAQLQGSMSMKDLTIDGKSYKGIPTVKMYGTQLTLFI